MGRATDQVQPWGRFPGSVAGHQLTAVPRTRAQAPRVKQESSSHKNFTNPLCRDSQGFLTLSGSGRIQEVLPAV